MELKKRKKEIEKKERRNRIIIGFLMVFIMVISVIGFALNLSHKEEKVNGFYEFPVNFRGEKIVLRTIYLPNETKNVPSYNPSIDDFVGQRYYFYSNEKIRQSSYRLLSYIFYFSLINEACLEGEECYNEELPIKNCDNNFIFFNYSDTPSIEKNKNCIIINGNESTIDLVIDRFIFDLFKIEEKKK